MILQPTQARRFYKLFYALIDYCAPAIGAKSTPRFPADILSDEQIGSVCIHIWGGSKQADELPHLELIDEFVTKNPYQLSQRDLREVSAWKDGLSSTFPVTRDGRDDLFVQGDHVFAVRGLTREASASISRLPAIVATVLLPFDGLITYGVSMLELPIDVGPAMEKEIVRCVGKAKREKKRVSSAKLFPDAAKAAAEEEARYAATLAELKAEEGEDGDDFIPEQHRGVLAGLSPEERDAAISKHLADDLDTQSAIYSVMREDIEAQVVPGAPITTIVQALQKLSLEDLRDQATRNGVKGMIPRMKRRELAESLAKVMAMDPESLMGQAILAGASALESVKKVYEAGGKLEFPDSDENLNNVPDAHFPATLLFHQNGYYVLVMPREVVDALADADWDECCAMAKSVDDAMEYLAAIIDLRGVANVHDCLAEMNERVENFDSQLLMFALAQEAQKGDDYYQIATVNGELYFVSHEITETEILCEALENGDVGPESATADDALDMLDDVDLTDFLQNHEHPLVESILDNQSEKPLCYPTEAQLKRSVADVVMEGPEAYALIAYLDEHVPDTQDDYTFAERVVEEIINMSRDLPDIKMLFGLLEDLDFYPYEKQLNEIAPLIMDLTNAVPKWMNNGWSGKDVPLEGRQQQIVFQDFGIDVRD